MKREFPNGVVTAGRIVRRAGLAAVLAGAGAVIGSVRAEGPTAVREPEPTPAEPLPERPVEAAAQQPGVEPAAPQPAAEKPKAPAKKVEDDLSTDEKQVLDQLNAERKRWGRRPLKLNRHLMRAARRHAANMARWNTMSHYLGGNVSQRVAATGVWMRSAGENIAQGQHSPRQVMTTWMASSGHRNNILSASYTDVGVAVARSSNGTPYWVQVFAIP